MKYTFSLLFFIAFSYCSLFAQTSDWYISSRCEPHYTFEAIDNKIEGRSILSFKINQNWKVIPDSIKIVKSLGYGLDEIAISTLLKMPGFPDSKAHSNTEKTYVIPILFTLNSVSDCEMSDYYLLKGLNATGRNNLELAFYLFKQAIDKDLSNAIAIKHLCLTSFKLGKEVGKAEKAWKKLYAQKLITEEEFLRKNAN